MSKSGRCIGELSDVTQHAASTTALPFKLLHTSKMRWPLSVMDRHYG